MADQKVLEALILSCICCNSDDGLNFFRAPRQQNSLTPGCEGIVKRTHVDRGLTQASTCMNPVPPDHRRYSQCPQYLLMPDILLLIVPCLNLSLFTLPAVPARQHRKLSSYPHRSVMASMKFLSHHGQALTMASAPVDFASSILSVAVQLAKSG